MVTIKFWCFFSLRKVNSSYFKQWFISQKGNWKRLLKIELSFYTCPLKIVTRVIWLFYDVFITFIDLNINPYQFSNNYIQMEPYTCTFQYMCAILAVFELVEYQTTKIWINVIWHRNQMEEWARIVCNDPTI